MICLVLLLGLVFAPSIFAQGYSITPVPGWVKTVQTPANDKTNEKSNSDGVAYLLVDHQWRISEGQQSYYRHFINRALNTSGVVKVSQISIDYDPIYESLVLHQITIHRNGRIIDRIDRSKINLIQREKNLEHQIYDGSKTLNIFIEDVRPGDSVEYSFTIEGVNPVFSGHFSERLNMAWEVPVGSVHYRVLWPSSRSLYIRNHETDIEPGKRISGQHIEYVWSYDKVNALISDKDTPRWYAPFPVVYLSDMARWDEVTAWALPLYYPAISTPSLKEVISPILETTSSTEQRVLAALHFVQNEVRYLGEEMGVNSHKPTVPDVVLKQRFGDCKDKSRLLVSLLQSMGIEVSPVLVNTYIGKHVMNLLPTPTAFNHVMVLARVNGKNYWLDPTRTYQSGTLHTLYQPDYGYALVVSAQHSDLVKMSDDITSRHNKMVVETFNISDAIDKPVNYQILSNFEGYYADSIREYLAESNPSQMQQSYLNYTAHYYPDVQIADKIKVSDDDKRNKLTLTEYYSIPNIWTTSDDKRYVSVEFKPFLIDEYIKDVTTPVRTMPYAVAHPVRYHHTTRIHMQEDSSFDDEFIEVKDMTFKFTKKVTFSNDILVIDYIYESLNDHVKPENIQTYSKHINEVQDLAYYQVQMPNPAINFGQYHFEATDINWMMVIIVSLALICSTYLSLKYIYWYDPPYQAPKLINAQIEGFGGWLILPGLAIVVTPIRILMESRELWYIFSAKQWSIVEDNFGAGLLITVSLEMICNAATIVMALFMIFMFFNRRHTFPRFFIAYLIFMLALVGADLLAIHLLSSPGIAVSSADVRQLTRQAVSVVIWSLYFMKSERVKATFTRQRNHEEPLQGTADNKQDMVLQDAG